MVNESTRKENIHTQSPINEIGRRTNNEKKAHALKFFLVKNTKFKCYPSSPVCMSRHQSHLCISLQRLLLPDDFLSSGQLVTTVHAT